ncbi:MAG: adventurous gliding motility protein CglE [Pseudomonadota bacterium]
MKKQLVILSLALALAPLARAQVSSQVEGFEYSRGFYTESDLGFFLRFGGFADEKSGTVVTGSRTRAVIVSNLQPYIGFSVGYDVLDFLSVQLSYGTGYVANAAPRQGQSESPMDHSITLLNLAIVGNLLVMDRLAIEARVFGGGAIFAPPPVPDASMFGGNAGAGLGIKYMTLLPGFIIGADVNFLTTFPEIVPALTFSPLIIKYVF